MVVTEDMMMNNQWVGMDTKLEFPNDIAKRFMSHQLTEDQAESCDAIRHTARDMATCINDLCPAGRERSLAMNRLDEATMWANAAIARA